MAAVAVTVVVTTIARVVVTAASIPVPVTFGSHIIIILNTK
jgi:hypothetical protein